MRKFLIFGVLIGMHIVLFAFTPPKISFDHFGVEDGFYGKSVTVILQDSRDFLWIGTREGLYRYNGYTFEVFQHNSTDSTCISSNVISSIAEDRDGNIWVGTIKGINLFNRAGNNFLRDFSQFDNAGALLQTQNVRRLFVDRLNNIWAGTDRSEVFVLKKWKKSNNANNGFDQSTPPSFDTSLTNGWTAFRVSHADLIRNQRTIVFISQDDIGDVWVGGMHAFYIINPENLDVKRKILFEDGYGYVIQNGITRICKIDEGLFWLGSINGGLYKFNISTNKITPYYLREWGNDSKTIDLITSIYKDDKGNLWIGTRDKGLFYYNLETDRFHDYFSDPSNAKSLSNNTILSILRDKFDLMWVGPWNGLNRGIFENKRFVNIKALPTSRQKAEVKGFYFDKHGKIWMATDHGLNILNPDFTLFRRFIYKPYDDKGISHFVTCDIKSGPGNRIYLATFGGIDIFDEGMNIVGHIRQTDYPNKSLGDNYVFDMIIDGDTLWAGTMNGLSRINLNTGTVKNYFSEEYEGRESGFLNSTIIYALERDSAGNIWAGGNKGLLVILKKNGRTVRYLHDIHDPGSISNNSIRDVFTDSKGNVWAGTANGLNKWLPDQKKFIKYITDEIPNIEVTSINEDKTGKLWLGTKMNLLRFNPQNGEVIRYHEHDGINSCKFIQHAVSSDESGRLYFGTSDGMITFYPDLIRNYTIGTKVYITEFKILNKSIRAGEIVNGRMILNESIEMCDTIHVLNNILSKSGILPTS